jgi:LysM repeat protein
VLGVCVIGLVGLLIQGCKREEPPVLDNTGSTDTNSTAAVDTNTPPSAPDTNLVTTAVPPAPAGNAPVGAPGAPVAGAPAGAPPSIPQPAQQPLPLPPVPGPSATVDTGAPAAGGTEYTIAKGDTLGKVAHHNGVSLKALLAANPGVSPTKLKIGQKITIPAGGTGVGNGAVAGATATAATADASADGGFVTYTVKSGDSLRKIAKAHHTTVKAIQAANHLTTTAIKVGHKLKIPSKAAAPAAPVAAPVDTTPVPAAIPAPAPQPASAAPVSVPAPAPAGTPGQ